MWRASQSHLPQAIAVQYYACMDVLRRAQRHKIDAFWMDKQTSSALPLLQNEQVFRNGSIVSSFNKLLLSEQKKMVLKKDIIHMFTLPDELVMNYCAGTFLVAKASMLDPQHRQFVGCDPYSKYIASSLPQFTLKSIVS